jgi:hypothetical protein
MLYGPHIDLYKEMIYGMSHMTLDHDRDDVMRLFTSPERDAEANQFGLRGQKSIWTEEESVLAISEWRAV